MSVTAVLHLAFHGHESPKVVCGDDPPEISNTWIQYPGDPESNSPLPLPIRRKEEGPGDCFHPNEVGAATISDFVNLAAVELDR